MLKWFYNLWMQMFTDWCTSTDFFKTLSLHLLMSQICSQLTSLVQRCSCSCFFFEPLTFLPSLFFPRSQLFSDPLLPLNPKWADILHEMVKCRRLTCLLCCCEVNLFLWVLKCIAFGFYLHFTQCPNCFSMNVVNVIVFFLEWFGSLPEFNGCFLFFTMFHKI